MKTYQSYKQSGIEWIGDIPEHWVLISTNKVFNNIGSGTTPKSENNEYYDNGKYNWITTSDLNEGILTDTLQKLTDKTLTDYPTLKLYPSSSIFISMYGGKIGKIGVSTFQSYCNQSVCVLPTNSNTEMRFYYYWFLGFQEQVKSMGRGGGQPNINKDMIKEFPVCKLPLYEQLQIVQFLDEKTELVDKLISTKERKITLLKQQRTSLINEVITKGLNPDVKMKESGVDWIGEIPEHWILSKLKWITLEHRQGYYSSNDYDDTGYRMVRITDINDDNSISVENSPFYEIEETDYWRFGLTKGDFLFPRTGGVGRFGIFDSHIQSIYGSFLIRFRFSNEIIHSFIKFYLNSSIFLTEIEKEIHGGVNKNVHVENIKDCIIVYPKLSNEQITIVEYLENRTKEIDELVSMEQKKIDLLKEYRQSLISEVITGKIDVRN